MNRLVQYLQSAEYLGSFMTCGKFMFGRSVPTVYFCGDARGSGNGIDVQRAVFHKRFGTTL